MPNIRVIAAAIGVALAASASAAQAASPYERQCKSTITTVGAHKQKSLAIKIAKQSWAQQVAASYGSVWASLQNAAGGGLDCSPGHPGWQCIFSARPCRYVDTRGITPHAPGTRLQMRPIF